MPEGTSAYPGSLDTGLDDTPNDPENTPLGSAGGSPRDHDNHHADVGAAVMAVQSELGTNPSGSEATVGARITSAETGQTSHLNDTADAHDASAISYAGGTGISATHVEGAIDELATEKANQTDLDAHLSDSSDSHDASAVSYAGGTGISATDVEGAIDELATEKLDATTFNTHATRHAAGGADPLLMRHLLQHWFQENVSGTQSAVALGLNLANARTEIPMVRAGSVTGIVVLSNAARTGGTLTVDVTINGTVTGLQATLDGTNTTVHQATQATGADTFVAGDRIGVKITTSSWTPTTADISVEVEVAT